jgi:hypothetical protein
MRLLPLASALFLALALTSAADASAAGKRNVVIFVSDGLRYDSVTKDNAPTMWGIRHDGVDFTNSHSLYPTLTTANASAIATGHYLGDTGDFANTLYVGFPVVCKMGAVVVFLEDDCVLREVKQHAGNDYLGQTTLLQAARAQGYVTAVVGKLGPAAIQDLGALDGNAILIDDVANKPNGADGLASGSAPLDPALAADIARVTGASAPPLASVPNTDQQAYLSKAAALAVLPYLKKSGKPFVLLFWSRDPDASQHGQTDSLGALTPGINGATSKAAIANADASLKAITDALATLGLAKNTDIFLTADHGFSTIAKSTPTADGDVPVSHLPQGFMAISVAGWLGKKIFDPDLSSAPVYLENGDHPSRGNGLIGDDPNSPDAVVAANGGSDLLWFVGPNARANAKTVFDHLMQQDYVSGIFVNDALMDAGDAKDFAGALRTSDIGLDGASHLPAPSFVVNFRSFPAKGCTATELLCAAEIADTNLTVGQGMHGSLSRAETRNFMAAIGPDFRSRYADPVPIGNADIAPTIAHILGLKIAPKGDLSGRVIVEALKGGKAPPVSHKILSAMPGPGGLQTVLQLQLVGGTRYFDAGGFPGRTVGLTGR